MISWSIAGIFWINSDGEIGLLSDKGFIGATIDAFTAIILCVNLLE